MRRFTSLIAIVAAVSLLDQPVAAQSATEINVAHVLSEQSSYQYIFRRFAELMKEQSQGKVTVRVQCCGQAGTEPRLIQSVRTGVIDGAFVGGSSLETVVKDYRVLSLPYVFDDNAQADRILQGQVGDKLLARLEPHGMLGLGFGANFERNIGSRKPVNKVEDLAGLKIRVLQTPGFVETYKAFGTQPTPMAYGELFLALQNGVVDALEVSPDAFVNDRFVEVIPNYALTKAHQSTTVFIVSKAKFEALPPDVRSMARTAAREAIKHGLTEHARLNREGLATARAKNVTIVEPELGPFKTAARRSYDTILAEAPEGRAILNEIEAAKRSQ